MFAKIKAQAAFNKLLSRPDINKAYALTDPSDSWYPTLKKVHDSLAEIKTHPHENLEITSADGLRLCAVCYPVQGRTARGTVIFIHGYSSHAEREWAFPSLFYLSRGFNVIIPYQRAHGPSEGKLITMGALECGDMKGWVSKAEEIFPGAAIVIHGLSMGGGIALQLCDAELPNVRCMVADAPALGVNLFIQNVSSHFKSSDRDAIQKKMTELFEKKTGLSPDVTEIFPHINRAKFPIYLTAGSLENMDGLFEKIKSDCPTSVETVILDGCNHGNGMYKQTEVYHEKLSAFLDKYFE